MLILVAATAGVVLGYLGGPVAVLLPWAAVALLCGARARTAPGAVVAGLIFGSVVSFVFLIRGYAGRESVLTVVPLFLGLAAFGAICGAILGGSGWLMASRFRNR